MTAPVNTQADPEVTRALGLDKPKSRKLWRWGLGLLIVGGVIFGIQFEISRQFAASVPKFKMEKVIRKDLALSVSATGNLYGLNTVEVGAEVTGRVTKVLVDYNDTVKRGQILAEIDPEQLVAAADQARAQLLVAEAAIRTAEANLVESRQGLDRAKEQTELGLVSRRELEAAEAAAARADASLGSAKANAELARAGLKSATSRVAKTTIVAPIDGMVLARSVEPGQTVTAGFQTPILFKLAEDLTRLTLRVDVDEADIGKVHEGQEAMFTVDAWPDRTFPSKVLSLRNEPKRSQNVVTYEAVLAVDNSDRLLRPGMTAIASIVADTVPKVVVVPNAALRFVPPGPDDDKPKTGDKTVHVLVDGVPKAVKVRTGRTDGESTELLDAGTLAEGTEVIVDVES